VNRAILLSGEPKSTQHIYRNTCRGGFSTTYMTAEGKALKEQYQWEARSQWKGKPLEGDIEVSITLYFGTKRRADLDNFNKLSLDALTCIAYLDDSQIAKLTIERSYDKLNPRIEITVLQDGIVHSQTGT
jgi:Holliday junction resolvase RusA-like endonuclease